jgi:hypothetical protein
MGNDEANKLAKKEALESPFHLISHQTPFWSSITSTSTQHDISVRNLKAYIEKSRRNTLTSLAFNTITYANKWFTNKDLHPKGSNILRDVDCIVDAQLS